MVTEEAMISLVTSVMEASTILSNQGELPIDFSLAEILFCLAGLNFEASSTIVII